MKWPRHRTPKIDGEGEMIMKKALPTWRCVAAVVAAAAITSGESGANSTGTKRPATFAGRRRRRFRPLSRTGSRPSRGGSISVVTRSCPSRQLRRTAEMGGNPTILCASAVACAPKAAVEVSLATVVVRATAVSNPYAPPASNVAAVLDPDRQKENWRPSPYKGGHVLPRGAYLG